MEWVHVHTSFKNRVFCGQIISKDGIQDPKLFLEQCMFFLIDKVGEFMYKFQSPVKLNCELACEYILKKGEIVSHTKIYHQSKMSVITLNDDFTVWFSANVVKPILVHMSEFQERDSRKALNKILYLKVNINKFDATNSGGSSYINLPLNIKSKKAVIKVINLNEKCFVWSILSALYPLTENSNRPYNYPQNYDQILNLSNINFPTPLSDISKFEKQNDISINVYGLDFNTTTKEYNVVGPLHYTKNKKERHINLIYWKNESQSHYAWIKSLSRLLSTQLSKHNGEKYICDRCLQYFGCEYLLHRHEEDCIFTDAVKIEMPTEDKKW